jgi:hypothetical protein
MCRMFDELKRLFKVWTIPADRVRRLLAVNALSISLSVHTGSELIDSWINHKPLSTIVANFSMPFYKDHVYPHLVTLLGNPKPMRDIRQRVVPIAQGTVLEIGVGPGVNFSLYDATRVSKVFALEPNPGMVRRAVEQGRRTKLDIEFLLCRANASHWRTAVLIRWLARLPCARFQA